MTNYVVLMNYSGTTDQATVDAQLMRTEIEQGLARVGAQLVELYWTLGRYDLVAVVNLDRAQVPAEFTQLSDAAIADGFAEWLGNYADVRTETLTGLDKDSHANARAIAARCGGSGLQPAPGH